MNRGKRYLGTALLIASILLSGCLEFESIEQPSSVLPGELFTVLVEVTVEETGGYPVFGIRLPVGWTIPGDTIAYTGVFEGSITYDPNLSLQQEGLSPAAEGYYWWLGAGTSVEGADAGAVFAEVPIQPDPRPGRYFLDYLLDSAAGSCDLGDAETSKGHIIEVVDEWTPRELNALSLDRSAVLTWLPPLEQEGLAGYRVYRDGQLLDAEPLSEAAYSDMDLPGGVFYYSVSSLYENGNEHVTPYEIKALVFSGGSGEPNAPYQITLAEQLVAIADFSDLLDKHFVLNNNIDLDPNLPGAGVFNLAVTPTFSGTFDGQGHEIQHLTMAEDERTNGRLGLFGILELGGRVWNLGITDVNIASSSRFAAGLVGQNNGDLDSCYVTGEITGGNGVGGLVGGNDPNGQIANCYSTGVVSGEVSVGGLVGWNGGSIISSYSTNRVSGRNVSGGLVGNNEGSVSGSFWDVQTSGQAVSDGGAGLTTDEMMDPFMVGLNGLANDPNWVLDAGRDYPRLAWEGTAGTIVPAVDMDWLIGQGTADSPHVIDTADQLILLSKASILWDKHFLLGADIDLDPGLPGRQVFGQAVIPVFAGVFDGADHVISNLRITGTRKLGLFGALTSEAEVRNLGVVDVQIDVTGDGGIGGLVGINDGNIVSSYSTGRITGRDFPSGIGGLVGYNSGGITMSFSAVTVEGSFDVGGLVGGNEGNIVSSHSIGSISGRISLGGLAGNNRGSIISSYSSSTVAGSESPGGPVGGLVGSNHGSIATSYSTGWVSGTESVGGLVGDNTGSVDASFWDVQTSGQAGSAGGTGLAADEMMDPFMVGLNGLANDPNWVLDAGRDYPRLAWEGTAGTIVPAVDMDWLTGQGTAEDPYLIDAADQLILLSKASILWDRHFLLGADIDLNPGLPGRMIFGQAVIPVFAGVFDGADHVISNLRIEGTRNVGLFGNLTGDAEVRNVGVANAQISGRDEPTAGLVGNNHGSIVSCFSTGAILIRARSGFNGKVSDVGGLAGRNDGNIIASFSTATVGGIGHVGGLVGWNDGSIVSCYSTGAVSGSRVDRGDRSPDEGTAGGLVGWNFHRGDIRSSYSVGLVSGTNYVGGFVGENYGSVDASFWEIQSSGQAASAGGTGMTTSAMRMMDTFLSAGWDFIGETTNGAEGMWWIEEGRDYPRLWWE